jgi:tripartite-type tricarboxylate transporter receptor subunit TctC
LPCILALAGLFCVVHPADAQPADAMDRPLSIYVAGTAGGGIDLYARLVARHLGRHIPGNPVVTVQDMPGAGGIRAASYLATAAPRDGTAIATFAGGPVLEPLIGGRNPGYDMSQFTWIGAVTKDVRLCVSWGASPFKTIDDAKKQEMIVAGTGAGSETDTWPIILNDVLGTRFKVVTGYLGSQETILAIERGEHRADAQRGCSGHCRPHLRDAGRGDRAREEIFCEVAGAYRMHSIATNSSQFGPRQPVPPAVGIVPAMSPRSTLRNETAPWNSCERQ